MADDGSKSAYELAMEKLRRQDEARQNGGSSLEEKVAEPKASAPTVQPTAKASSSGNIDFDDITSKLKSMQETSRLGQIAPSITDAYLSYARYKDANGVVMYKNKFSADEAESLADSVYEQLSYHTHRRFYNMSESQMDALKGIVDPYGNSYMDTQVKHQFDLDRSMLRNSLKARAEQGETIDDKLLGAMLEDKVKYHSSKILQSILSPIEPKHMDALKAYITGLVERHNLDKAVGERAKNTYDMQSLVQQYLGIAMNPSYSEPSRIITP